MTIKVVSNVIIQHPF